MPQSEPPRDSKSSRKRKPQPRDAAPADALRREQERGRERDPTARASEPNQELGTRPPEENERDPAIAAKSGERGAYEEVPDPFRDRDESTSRRGTSVWEDTTDAGAPDEAGAAAFQPEPHEDFTPGYGQNVDPEDDRYAGHHLAPREPGAGKADPAARTSERGATKSEHRRSERQSEEPSDES